MKKAVLLVNLGTPESPQPKHVRKYLTEFLNDPFVIDLPWLMRKLLVNLIIIPFRLKKSTRLYRRLWTNARSPISIYLEQLRIKLQKQVGEGVTVYAAMRYGEPSLKNVLTQINDNGADELLVFALFPQYASSTTGSIIHAVQKSKNRLQNVKKIHFSEQFYYQPSFIDAFCERITSYQPASFDHIIFSCHSLPIRHIEGIHPAYSCANCSCENELPSYGSQCYKATSYETSRLIANKLQIKREAYTVAFQSRFSKNWIGPFTEDIIIQSALSGKSKVLIVAPSFVADCLETIVEIGQDYKKLFQQYGGKELVMVESLNAEDYWVKALSKIIINNNQNS
jgi:protoporphyrin/coproporphyrin ferrochelatase